MRISYPLCGDGTDGGDLRTVMLRRPLVIGQSRTCMLGSTTGRTLADRLPASIAAATVPA